MALHMDSAGQRGWSVRIGCAGWSIPKQIEAKFSAGGSHLHRYSARFNCCEINSSFYRPHKLETWERWASSVPADFRFSVKFPKAITHEAKLNCGTDMLSAFVRQIVLLREKLGPVLVQLPPSLEFDRDRAKKFLTVFREIHSGDIVFEPRHISWFDERVDRLLGEFRVARVAADPACVPVAARPAGWSRLAYFRLHGSPRMYYSAYSSEFLDRLSEQLISVVPSSEVWCVFDNTAAGYAIENALALQSKIVRAIATPAPGSPSKIGS